MYPQSNSPCSPFSLFNFFKQFQFFDIGACSSDQLLSSDMRTATTKFQALHEHSEKGLINGPRPSSLSINKDSHLIRKSSSSSTSFVALTKPHKNHSNPIIIYTQSPQVIHTKPRDFMALVQRLTGMTHSSEHVFDATASRSFGSLLCDGSNSNMKLKEEEQHGEVFWADDKILSPDLRDSESCVKKEPFVPRSISNLGFSDVPIFTPNTVYKYADSPFGFLGTLLSPSGLEFMKELPEY
ncbi:VQ motif-containing protein 8 [Spatholobus suberectus]|nr:VQ motif-containing protein 8 [Spatholobus suberectus]